MKEKLYAHRIERRAITILDVPEQYREGVMALLGEFDRARQERILGQA
jgi:hypothetical protein